MRVHGPLDDVIRGRGTLHVLRQFCLSPGRRFTGPELARSGGLALSHIQGALAILESHGLIDRHVVGKSHVWALSSSNLLVRPLTALFKEERDLCRTLTKTLSTALAPLPVQRAILFGSITRAEENGWSDVDLFLEVASRADQERVLDALVPLFHTIRDRFGLNLSPIIFESSVRPPGISSSLMGAVKADGISLLKGE